MVIVIFIAVVGNMLGLTPFTLSNSPLWLINRLVIFAGGPDAPRWFVVNTTKVNQIFGFAAVLLWLAIANHFSITTVLLLGTILIIVIFLLLNTPFQLVSHFGFAHGTEVSSQLQTGMALFSLVLGTTAIISILHLVCHPHLLN